MKSLDFLIHLAIGILLWPLAIIFFTLNILFFPLIIAIDLTGDELPEEWW